MGSMDPGNGFAVVGEGTWMMRVRLHADAPLCNFSVHVYERILMLFQRCNILFELPEPPFAVNMGLDSN